MSNTAAAIGSMFVVPSGLVAVTSLKACHGNSSGARQVFAHAAPLAGIRDEIRSYKKSAAEPELHESPDRTRVRDRQTDPVELLSEGKGRQTRSTDRTDESVEGEMALPAAELPVSQVPIETDAIQSVSVETDGVDVPALVPAELAEAPATEMAAELTMVSDRQELHAVAHAASKDGRMLSRAEVSAVVETPDGRSRSVQAEMTASVGEQGVETSGKILIQDKAVSDAPDNPGSIPAATTNTEVSKAVMAGAATVVTKDQGGESVDTQSKDAVQVREAVDPSKAVGMESAPKPQVQMQAEAQPLAEGSKNLDRDQAPVISRATQAPERELDAMRQEDGQASSRQDGGARPQSANPTIGVAESGEKSPVPVIKELAQPQMDVTAVSEGDSANVSPRLSAEVTGPGPLDAASAKSPVQDVGEQILSSIHASMARADKQVQIRLDPPELGSVMVRITEQGGQIRGFLEVGREDTRREIEQALPQVLKGLQDAGVQVRRLEVVVSDQPDKGSGREPLQQDAWAQQQQQNPDQQGYRSQQASAANWSASASFRQGLAAQNDPIGLSGQGPLDRIDMLM